MNEQRIKEIAKNCTKKERYEAIFEPCLNALENENFFLHVSYAIIFSIIKMDEGKECIKVEQLSFFTKQPNMQALYMPNL